jgi:hypothetical protein
MANMSVGLRMRLSLGAAAAAIAMGILTGSAPARTTLPAQKAALAGINRAVAKGWIDRSSAAHYRYSVNRAATLIRCLPWSRSAPLQANLGQVARLASKLTAPRARALFGQLAVNDAYLAHRSPPADQTDTTDEDGIVYRYFSGLGFEFHPLAEFGALNAAVSAGNADAAERLADALIERGVPEKGGGAGWEYYFDYSGGSAPWLSGMAQAVAAQAFAGASQLLPDDAETLMAAARSAFRAIPGRLVVGRATGPWIKLYSFSNTVVLNAQLQTVVSLKSYANASIDADASSLAGAMERAAATDLHLFDTGYWTYYSLPRTPSPLSYQSYVVRLLRKLAPDDTRFDSAALRFAAYAKQPPAFQVANSNSGTVRFWLSKPASVEVRSTGATKRMTLYDGWHVVGWEVPKRAGSYSVEVTARDWAGNSASFSGLPMVRVVTAPVWKVTSSSRAQTKSVLDAAETGAAVRARASTMSVLGGSSFSAGVGLDSTEQVSLATGLGLSGGRLQVAWTAPETAPSAATVAQLNAFPADQRLLVELVADSPPASDAERSELAAFAGSLVTQVPGIDDVLLAPAPTVSTAPAYSDALAAVRDAVHGAAEGKGATIAVAGELDGSASPKATLKALANEFLASGRQAALMDELAFEPASSSDTSGAWTIDDYPDLVSALGNVFLRSNFQEGSDLPIVVYGVALPTTIPAGKVDSYPNPPGTVPGASENSQSMIYSRALRNAVCMPTVTALVFRRLVDGSGDQSGLFYADGSAKTSALPVGDTAGLAVRGALAICPGLGVQVAASKLVFPLQVSTAYPPRVMLACTRDCLYLVTLERADGKPVLAKRGALNGTTAPAVVQLPRGTVTIGASYRIRVRLVAQTNPGPIKQYWSPAIKAG